MPDARGELRRLAVDLVLQWLGPSHHVEVVARRALLEAVLDLWFIEVQAARFARLCWRWRAFDGKEEWAMRQAWAMQLGRWQ